MNENTITGTILHKCLLPSCFHEENKSLIQKKELLSSKFVFSRTKKEQERMSFLELFFIFIF